MGDLVAILSLRFISKINKTVKTVFIYP